MSSLVGHTTRPASASGPFTVFEEVKLDAAMFPQPANQLCPVDQVGSRTRRCQRGKQVVNGLPKVCGNTIHAPTLVEPIRLIQTPMLRRNGLPHKPIVIWRSNENQVDPWRPAFAGVDNRGYPGSANPRRCAPCRRYSSDTPECPRISRT
jgi:hypothetical protein